MTEILLIIFHVFLIALVFSINPLAYNEKLLSHNKITLPENISFNFLLTANMILILSFFNLKLTQIIICYSIYIIFLFFFFLKNKFFESSKKKLLFLPSLIIIVLISLIITLDISNKLVLSWDSEKFWLYKKLNFYNNFSIENLQNLQRPHYPFLGGLLGSFFWKISFISHEYASRLFLGLVYVVSIYSLIENIKTTTLHRLLFLLLFILITYDYLKLFSGNQEILIFVFILASFNLVSSLTMLFLEKKDNFLAFKSLGLTKSMLFNVFFIQGLLISLFGIIIGMLVGYLICFIQLSTGLLHISPGQAYPIGFSFYDFLTIIGSVSALSVLFSFTTVKLLLLRSEEI